MQAIIVFLFIDLIVAQSPRPGFHHRPDHCRPLENCAWQCPYRFRFGADGCEICQCRSSPCFNETDMLPNTQCDRTATGPKCPSTHHCVVTSRGDHRASSTSGAPPLTARGVCCIYADFQAMGFSRPPTR